MAPIARIASNPLSIITGALFTAFSAPSSSPPTDGVNATVWGTEYTGSASYFDLSLFNSTSPTTTSTTTSSTKSTSSATSTSSSTPSPTPTVGTSNSSLVYYNTKSKTYTGCDNKPFSPTDNVALMNPLQFGDINSDNSTCGEWIEIQNRENTMQSTFARIVGVCDDCEYGSVDLSIGALSELAPDVPFEDIVFDSSSNNTIAEIADLDDSATTFSPYNLVNIVWSLSDPPSDDSTGSQPTATKTATATSTSTTSSAQPTTTSTSSSTALPSPTSTPSKQYTGRATWYSDTNGQCEHSYSQSDLIVAVNQAQMGTGTKICGKKILLTEKGSNVQVIVTVVDMCPSQYCSFGDLDLSQAAFKKFAKLSVGELQLQWSFL
ncbi:hypothetical protein BGZ80_010624 [Entomortierella chlamydospora]|uniref:RlpA-like protein double-psi beta-barrel domain-containing protein n=1 Tax=Entomortierella chlamydospora TaxID=101097 RepID=A0A9P6N390_9FUNG|nr:hypothetical protein BGZ79_005962 [Entomortierella chlamydospora]KAG0023004.1 hypothetical protein BGZ80_010624 [Entomortierella chlamydospora]